MEGNFLHLAPTGLAFFLATLDVRCCLMERRFFGLAKEKAVENLHSEIMKKIDVSEENRGIISDSISNWHFNCFRTAMFGVSQLQFLELMLCQSLIFMMVYWQRNEQLLPFLLLILFITMYIATFLNHEGFTWYHPKTPVTEGKPDHNRFLQRRFFTILLTGTLLFFTEDLTHEVYGLLGMIDNGGLSTGGWLFLLMVVGMLICLLVTQYNTKRDHFNPKK